MEDLQKPIWLDDDASAEWDRITAWLKTRGMYDAIDASALGAYCVAVGKVIRCQRELKNASLVVSGAQGGQIANPLIGIQSRAIAEVSRLAKEFGFTVRARGNIKPSATKSSRSKMPESVRVALGKPANY